MCAGGYVCPMLTHHIILHVSPMLHPLPLNKPLRHTYSLRSICEYLHRCLITISQLPCLPRNFTNTHNSTATLIHNTTRPNKPPAGIASADLAVFLPINDKPEARTLPRLLAHQTIYRSQMNLLQA